MGQNQIMLSEAAGTDAAQGMVCTAPVAVMVDCPGPVLCANWT